MIPAWRNAAMYTAWLPASDPVWEEAAFCPTTEAPALMATTGFFGVILLTISMNLRPSRICST